MKDVGKAFVLVLKDVAQLNKPQNSALVGALAGGIVAVLAKVAGVSVSADVVVGWIVACSGIAATIEKTFLVKSAAADAAAKQTFNL